MKPLKALLVIATAALAALPAAAFAHGGVGFGITIGIPAPIYPAPVYVPPPVYAVPPPAAYYPPPTYYPRPVVVYRTFPRPYPAYGAAYYGGYGGGYRGGYYDGGYYGPPRPGHGWKGHRPGGHYRRY